MTFLELCQASARESGVVDGTKPTAVTGQTGLLSRIVYWTNEAWTRIQNDRDNWLWMRGEFSYDLTAGTARYSAASFGITRFANWVVEQKSLTLYDPDTGVSDEGPLQWISWQAWRDHFLRGSQINNKPGFAAVSPTMQLCFGPVPDDGYKGNGEYWKSAQTLADNDDVPELPARFHKIIAYRAVMLLGEFDEAPIQVATAKGNYEDMLSDLERDQLPPITLGASLA